MKFLLCWQVCVGGHWVTCTKTFDLPSEAHDYFTERKLSRAMLKSYTPHWAGISTLTNVYELRADVEVTRAAPSYLRDLCSAQPRIDPNARWVTLNEVPEMREMPDAETIISETL